ncbi:hypothetical protein [Rhizobium sp. SAFR-030]|uniref:hypothetical protein n=1 Tax=Rhizobium sp. SAFR-030 TaxID=3387277 RepID=UPI003F802560
MMEDTDHLAGLLAEAIATGGLVDKTNLVVPDVQGAYVVQAAILDKLGVSQPQGYKFSLRDGQLFGAPLIFVESAREFPFAPGIRIEVELAMTLGQDLPPRGTPYTREEVQAAIETVAIGIELVRSRYIDGAGDAYPLLLSDMMSNVGYVLGPELDRHVLDAGADLGGLTLTNGAIALFDGPAKHPDADPLAAVLACANRGLPTFNGGFLRKGQVVTTGTLSGAPYITAPSEVTAALGGASLSITLKG